MFGGALPELIAKRPEVPWSERDIRVTKFAGRAFLVVFAMTHLWASRYQMNEDGISYLDIGDAFFHGDWWAAVNLYWSPLYPLVLGGVRRALPVPMKLEYPLVHAAFCL